MRYYVEHLGDNALFSSQLEKNTKLDRLRMEENKERIILRNGGGIFIISVQAGNSKKGIEAAMGAGCENVIQDESSLIPDPIEATVFRMIAGKGPNAFYCKIGNPFYRNHFLKSYNDKTYHQVFIDDKIALKEGRYTKEFLDEARKKPYYDVLFRCKFPPANALDSDGFSVMFTEDYIRSKIKSKIELFGLLRWAVDVAGDGSNYSTIVERGKNGAKLLYKENNPDTMNLANIVLTMFRDAQIKPEKIYVDKVGIGKGLYDRLREFPEIRDIVIGVSAGVPAESKDFFNKRAEMFWRTKEWLSNSELVGKDFIELANIRYKVQSDRKVQIKSKQDMLKDGIESPDVADALSLTFYDKETFSFKKIIRQEIPPTSKYEGTLEPRKKRNGDDPTDDELAKM